MTTLQPVEMQTLVVGLGQTGLACAHFLAAQGVPFAIADSRENPPGLQAFQREFPHCRVYLGEFERELFKSATQILLSPGVAPQEPAVMDAKQAGVEVIGDVELFARYAKAPVVAITGSNGKSTVTALLGEMVMHAGRSVQVGGNIGTPVLALLEQSVPDLYVVELSSFQLEVTASLNCLASTVLNLSDDHLDRHHTMENYAAIKARIYHGDGVMVINADDPRLMSLREAGRRTLYFTLSEPANDSYYGLHSENGVDYLAKGHELLLPVTEMRMPGRHNQANALSALALGEAAGLPLGAMLQTLREFPGLPHRCQWAAEISGVSYYEDSKGTNVGATLAALEGMPGEKVVLIAGGQGKGQDFTLLRDSVAQRARLVVLMGEDAALLGQALKGVVEIAYAGSMREAVDLAYAAAKSGDSVLLSPACASFDMFKNYMERGEAFVAAVQEKMA